jgi:hypothetical protein
MGCSLPVGSVAGGWDAGVVSLATATCWSFATRATRLTGTPGSRQRVRGTEAQPDADGPQ